MSEIDLPRLRTIAAKSEMSLARIDRSKLFYLNFDRSLLDQDEIDMLLAIECRLNRLSGILERIGAGLVPRPRRRALRAARSLMRGISLRRPTMFLDCLIRPRAITRGANRVRWLASRAVSGMCVPASRVLSRRLTWSRGSTIPIGQTLPRGLCSFGLGSLSLMPCRNVNTTLKMTPGTSWTRTRARSGPRSTMRAWRSRLRQRVLPRHLHHALLCADCCSRQ